MVDAVGVGEEAVEPAAGSTTAIGESRARRREGDGGRHVDPARQAVFEALHAVATGDSLLHLLLPQLIRRHGLFGADAAWTSDLAYGTVRLQGRYDAILALAAQGAILALAAQGEAAELDEQTLLLLRLGCHELLVLDVPGERAVAELAALARAGAGREEVVRDVLPRVAARSMAEWLDQIAQAAGTEEERLGRVYSHPKWIVRALREALAEARDELPDLLDANNTSAPFTLAVRPGLVQPRDLPQTTKGRYAPTARRLDVGDPAALGVVREGVVGIQDEGAQFATLVFARAHIDGTDRTWLDLCAGRGAKAALLASWLAARTPGNETAELPVVPRGGHVRPRTRRLVVNDLYQNRVDVASRALRAIPDSVDVRFRTGDGRLIGDEEPGRYDRVLVNAPSTGLGSLRRNPETRWRRKTADLAAVAEDQRALTLAAIAATRVGGIVGYLVCSPHSAETTFAVADVLKRAAKAGTPVEVVDATAALREVAVNDLPDQTGPYLQLWPHRHGTDAIFLALLRRVEEPL